ncbi:MAG: insulinase family protein [Gemmatimonadaceae bacterium]
MKFSREEIAGVFVAFALLLAGGVFVQQRANRNAAVSPPALTDAIPRDTDGITGTLPNGLHYFVRANSAPEHRAELRLVVNAGSVLEDPDQLGLAHAVEHMVFRGTKHFPGHAIDNYMQAMGMRAGEDINASTSHDETIVRFTIPTEHDEAIDTAVTILADIAHEATFDRFEAHREAGVVYEEWRTRLDARSELTEARDALLLAGSRYAGHSPIGDTAVLRRFDVNAMRRFYNDWYRPDLMAIVVVGDFDADRVERLVRRQFGAIPANERPRTRPQMNVVRAAEPRAAVLTDPEATGMRVSVWFPRRVVPQRTLGDARDVLVQQLLRDALNARLDDTSDRPGSPTLNANIDERNLTRSADADVLSADVLGDHTIAAEQLLLAELARLNQYGVSESELKRHGNALLKSRRESLAWHDVSSDIADSYADEFLDGNTATSREIDYTLARQLLPTITVSDLQRAARAYSIDRGAALVVTTADARLVHDMAPAQLVAGARAAANQPVEKWNDSTSGVTLFASPPSGGTIEKEEHVAAARVFQWTLSNGMKVILKPTRLVHDDIEMRLDAPGGASLATDADFPSAFLADGVLKSTGVGPLNGSRLRRYLDETSVFLTPYVANDAVGLSGGAAPRDLEKLFQLVNLYLTAPRRDTAAFARYHERTRHYVIAGERDPERAFDDTLQSTLSGHSPRTFQASTRFYDAVRLSAALSFWAARTANASNMTFILVGDFATERVRPLIEQYLAGLPAGIHETARGDGVRFPEKTVQRSITVGLRPKAKTEIVLSGPYEITSSENMSLNSVRDIAESALSDKLREKLGGTYDVSVDADTDLVPPAHYTLSISFEAAPERIDSLASVALSEHDRLRVSGSSAQEVEHTRAAEVRDLDGKIEQNDYWAKELAAHARLGWPLATISTHQASAKAMSGATLRAACARYLSTSRFVRVTLYPKATTKPVATTSSTR